MGNNRQAPTLDEMILILRKYQERVKIPETIDKLEPEDEAKLNLFQGEVLKKLFPVLESNILNYFNSKEKLSQEKIDFLILLKNLNQILEDLRKILSETIYKDLGKENEGINEVLIISIFEKEMTRDKIAKKATFYDACSSAFTIIGDLIQYLTYFISIDNSLENEVVFKREDLRNFLLRQLKYLKEIARDSNGVTNPLTYAEDFFYQASSGLVKPQIDEKLKEKAIIEVSKVTNPESDLGCPAVFIPVKSQYGRNFFDAIMILVFENICDLLFEENEEIIIKYQVKGKSLSFFSRFKFW